MRTSAIAQILSVASTLVLVNCSIGGLPADHAASGGAGTGSGGGAGTSGTGGAGTGGAATAGSAGTGGSTCGNGLLEATEGCDDHNTVAGDGCSATCTVESGWVCPGGFSTERSVCNRSCYGMN